VCPGLPITKVMHRLLKESPGGRLAEPYNQPSKSRTRARRLWPTFFVLGVVLLAVVLVVAASWPFTRAKVIAELENATQGKVEFGKFHRTWFPPGCVAENVTFAHYGNLPNATPITVRKLTIQGSFQELLNKHVPVMRMEGVHLVEQKPGFPALGAQVKSRITVDEYIFTSSVLEITDGAGKPPLKFNITELKLKSSNGVVQFETTLHNPEPPGDLRVSGSLGPWNKDKASQTPLFGVYSFRHADLGVSHLIGGILASDGSFRGTIQQLEIRGKTGMPDFYVKNAAHKMGLNTQFEAEVGRNGDVELKQVMARLGRSGIESQGRVAATRGTKGKTASVDLLVPEGRIQDFLFLFLKDKVAPMTGVFSFKGHATLPPGKERFLRKLELQGDFGINDARLSNPKTQSNLEALSEKAEGEPGDSPERVVSDLKGHVVLRNGTATFSHLTFKVPGAKAKLHGTYSLITHQINFRGRLLTEAQLPKVTKGIKSFLLKVISPILKKNHHGGGVLALTVTGIYPHPIYKTAPVADPI
jgi:AsmA-like C-terminal region